MSEVFNANIEIDPLSSYFDTISDVDKVTKSAQAALASSNYGVKVYETASASQYAKKNIEITTGMFGVRYYFDPNSNPSTSEVDTFCVRSSQGLILYYVNIFRYTTYYYVNVRIPLDDGTSWMGVSSTISDASHCIEIFFHRASSATANDGYLNWWIDDQAKDSKTGIDSYTRWDNFVSDLRWGLGVAGEPPNVGDPNYPIYFDEFIIRDDATRIGMQVVSSSVSPSASRSVSPSPSSSTSPSVSPSASASISPSGSESASLSKSGSPSSSTSPSSSLSPSSSESISASASQSPSSSESPSISPSVSASVSPSPTYGSTCWGHSTGVMEENTKTFAGNWSGTGYIEGSGDNEDMRLSAGDYMESEIVATDPVAMEILQNYYQAGDNATLKYRTGATIGACQGASWTTYAGSFTSLGYVQVRVEA